MTDGWAPFLAFESLAGNVDKQGIETVETSYYVQTFAEARDWFPADLTKTTGLPLTRRRYQQEWGNGRLLDIGKDGAFKVTFTNEGVRKPSTEETGMEFSGDGRISSDPASSHPRIKFLMAKYDGAIEEGKLVFRHLIPAGGVKFATSGFSDYTPGAGLTFGYDNTPYTSPSTGGGSGEIPNPLFDFKKYHAAAITWQVAYVTTRPRPEVTERLAKIDTPRRSPDGYLPEIPRLHTWLKCIGSPVWRGNTWKVTEAWMAGQWIRDVYS